MEMSIEDELRGAKDYINSLQEMLESELVKNKEVEQKNERLKYWLTEILHFWENESSVKVHQFSLREAKKALTSNEKETPRR